MKLFQVIQENFALLGINSNQSIRYFNQKLFGHHFLRCVSSIRGQYISRKHIKYLCNEENLFNMIEEAGDTIDGSEYQKEHIYCREYRRQSRDELDVIQAKSRAQICTILVPLAIAKLAIRTFHMSLTKIHVDFKIKYFLNDGQCKFFLFRMTSAF